MPLVFVHGVNTREDLDYYAQEIAREALLRRIGLRHLPNPDAVALDAPYWGDLGATPAWGGASLPSSATKSFGVDEIVAALAQDEGLTSRDAAQHPLLTRARTSFSDAVDLAWRTGALDVEKKAAAAWAESGGRAADYATANPSPVWLSQAQSDHDFLARLRAAADPPPGKSAEAFGPSAAWDKVSESADRLRRAASRLAGKTLTDAVRPALNRRASRFLGDVLVYLNERGDAASPGPIVKVIVEALRKADGARTDADSQLIVLAHSMGGNIVYDALTYFAPEIKVDVLLTVGSQVGWFEELKLFRSSDRGRSSISKLHAEVPPNTTRWLNVFDTSDVLAFAIEPIFGKERTMDLQYSTGYAGLSAHSGYFTRPSFYARLSARLKQ